MPARRRQLHIWAWLLVITGLPAAAKALGGTVRYIVRMRIYLTNEEHWETLTRAHGTIGKVSMIGNGSAEFTRVMGREADMSTIGFGERSGRYVMIVEDGVVTNLDIEKPRKFEVSDAETMLALL